MPTLNGEEVTQEFYDFGDHVGTMLDSTERIIPVVYKHGKMYELIYDILALGAMLQREAPERMQAFVDFIDAEAPDQVTRRAKIVEGILAPHTDPIHQPTPNIPPEIQALFAAAGFKVTPIEPEADHTEEAQEESEVVRS